MLFDGVQLQGLVLIRDSLKCDGTGALLWTVQQLTETGVFIAAANSPAHYGAIFKKAAGKLRFIQADSEWAEEAGSEMLEAPVTWNEDADRVVLKPEALLEALQGESESSTVFMDDLSSLYFSLNGDLAACIRFINALRRKFRAVVLRASSDLPFSLFEPGSSTIIELTALQSGYSRAIQGQIRIRTRQNWTLRTLAVSFFRETEAGLVPAQLY